MLPPQQRAQVERKLKSLSEQKELEDEIKGKIKNFSKTTNDTINSINQDPKKQLGILRNLLNSDLVQKFASFQATNQTLKELQLKMHQKIEQINKEDKSVLQQGVKYKKSIEQVQPLLLNLQKTVKERIQQEAAKRKKIVDDIQTYLEEIKNKTIQLEIESQNLDKENMQFKEKISVAKEKARIIEETIKDQVDLKDQESKAQRQDLNNQLQFLESEKQKAIILTKQFEILQNQNFHNKIALLVKKKKFSQFSTSFQGSATNLRLCKEELQKSVYRLNLASQQIEQSNKEHEQVHHMFLVELTKQNELESKIEQTIKAKETVKAHNAELQNKLKKKMLKTQA